MDLVVRPLSGDAQIRAGPGCGIEGDGSCGKGRMGKDDVADCTTDSSVLVDQLRDLLRLT